MVSGSGCPSAGQSSTAEKLKGFGFSTCTKVLPGNRRKAENPGPEQLEGSAKVIAVEIMVNL